MPYIGNVPKYGDNASNFQSLDDIRTYINTFDSSSTSIVNITDNSLTFNSHRYITGQRVTYNNGGGSSITGLTSGDAYYITVWDPNTIKLATSETNAISSTNIDLTGRGSGNHTLTTSFDGVNKKFKPTYDGGGRIQLTRGSQLRIAINNVLQRPFDVSTPTEGYGIENGAIVFSTAPTSADTFWGSSIASSFQTWDISDNKVDNFTGDGTTTDFALSKSPPTNESILVTIDGVTQYPNDNNATRAYRVISSNVISFTSPPANGTAIQVRHIGFAGAHSGGSGGVSAYNGRTGNVSLAAGDPLVGVGINSTGTLIGVGVTMLNFVGAGNTFLYNPSTHTVDISIAGGGGGSGEIDKETFNVTGNQTVFNLTEKYTTGYIDVYVNGVRLSPADFTETDDDTITLATTAVAGDVVDFVSHSAVVQNTVLQSSLTNLNVSGITTTNNLNITGTLTVSDAINNEKAVNDWVLETPITKSITTDTIISATSGRIMYTKSQNVEIANMKYLEISDGDSFVIDAFQLG